MISKEDYEELCTKIEASKFPCPRKKEEVFWNRALSQSLQYIKRLHEGTGLFQIGVDSSRLENKEE